MHVDRFATIVAFAFGAMFSVAAFAQDDEHFFEPGTKHVCVPSADGRGWNCDGAGEPTPAPAASDGPALRTSRVSDLNASGTTSSEAIALDEPPAPVATPVAPTAIAQTERPSARAESARPASRDVPNYLLAPEARDGSTPPASTTAEAAARPAETPPPVEPAPATPAPSEPVAETPTEIAAPTETPAPVPAETPVAAQETVPTPEPAATAPPPDVAPAPVVEEPQPAPAPVAETATPERAAPSEPIPPAPVAPPVAPPPVSSSIASMRGSAEFLALDGNRFVLELARGADRTAVANAAGAIALAGGEIYLLRLPRDGSAWYIAAWGEFGSIDEARSARGDAIANGADIPGWPRKIGPLQQEVRRADR